MSRSTGKTGLKYNRNRSSRAAAVLSGERLFLAPFLPDLQSRQARLTLTEFVRWLARCGNASTTPATFLQAAKNGNSTKTPGEARSTAQWTESAYYRLHSQMVFLANKPLILI